MQSFPAFELTLVVALILIGWAGFKIYELGPEVTESHDTVVALRDQHYLLSDVIETNLEILDEALTRFLESRDASQVPRFQKQAQQWEEWMAQTHQAWSQEVPAESKPSNELTRGRAELLTSLTTVEGVYTNYVKAARFLMANAGRPLIEERYRLRQQAAKRSQQHLLNLARKIRVSGEAYDLVLTGSKEQMGGLAKRIRDLRLGLLLALVAISFLLMLGLYRRKMAQTRAIIQEHQRQRIKQQATLEKLTHFGQLAQELAHEIKQPLTAMNARAYTLQKVLSSDTDAHKDASVIRNEIKRLDKIVKDFLELARPAEPQLVLLDAETALSGVRDLMATHLVQNGIEFKFEIEKDLQFRADPQQLKQVLINLLKNAAESVRQNGVITLRGKQGTRSVQGTLTEVAIIEIEDNGAGIPLDIQTKIFDPFFSTKGDGTGLGLAIAARIIDKHGGNLEFDTEPSKGTIFRIVLPAVQKEQTA